MIFSFKRWHLSVFIFAVPPNGGHFFRRKEFTPVGAKCFCCEKTHFEMAKLASYMYTSHLYIGTCKHTSKTVIYSK